MTDEQFKEFKNYMNAILCFLLSIWLTIFFN